MACSRWNNQEITGCAAVKIALTRVPATESRG